jgi:hypothetical protein
MITLIPGHMYKVRSYPAREVDGPFRFHATNPIIFRHRVGDEYPGNRGDPFDGTTTQELLRVIIARTKYVDQQQPDPANGTVLGCARAAIAALETRAAQRRGPGYLALFRQELALWELDIEDAAPCTTCGHIFCGRHK